MALEAELGLIQSSYAHRGRQEAAARRKIWQGFDAEVNRLTEKVSCAFREALKSMGPLSSSSSYADKNDTVEVHDYEVKFSPSQGTFSIELLALKTKDGVKDGRTCLHDYLDPLMGLGEELHPVIQQFKRNYHTDYIHMKFSYCDHK